MFKYARILFLLVAVAAIVSSGCTQAINPQRGDQSGIKDMRPPSGPAPHIN